VCGAPPAPTGLTATALSGIKVSLSWHPVTEPGAGCAIDHYVLQRGGITLATPSGTTSTDTSVASGTSYSYRVMAVATGGVKGALSTAVTVTTPKVADSTKPVPASNVKAVATSSSQANLSWSPGSDPQSGIKAYYVLRNGMRVATLPSLTLAFPDTGRAARTTYTYVIVTVDGAGLTANSASVTVTTP
jgi:chitinase